MFANLSDIIKIPAAILVGMAVSALVLILIYEGISIPFFGQVINGVVANRVDEATSKMVNKADLAAANALLDKAKREAAFNSAAADAARKQADNAQVELQTAQDKLDAAIAQDTDDDGCRVGDSDLQWLRKR